MEKALSEEAANSKGWKRSGARPLDHEFAGSLTIK